MYNYVEYSNELLYKVIAGGKKKTKKNKKTSCSI